MALLIMKLVTTVEASDIGLKPGEWPMEVKFQGWTWTSPSADCMGDRLLSVSYWCRGRKLIVVND